MGRPTKSKNRSHLTIALSTLAMMPGEGEVSESEFLAWDFVLEEATTSAAADLIVPHPDPHDSRNHGEYIARFTISMCPTAFHIPFPFLFSLIGAYRSRSFLHLHPSHSHASLLAKISGNR